MTPLERKQHTDLVERLRERCVEADAAVTASRRSRDLAGAQPRDEASVRAYGAACAAVATAEGHARALRALLVRVIREAKEEDE